MKKVFCILISVLMLFSLSACKNDKDNSGEASVDFEYFVNLGKIPECEFSLGESVSKIEEVLSEKAEKDEEAYFNKVEGENNALMEDGTYNYYYVKKNADKGVSYIVSYTTAFGFDIDDVSIEVEETLEEAGIKFSEESLNDKNAFFLYGDAEGSVIKCEFEKNTLMFAFRDNMLCATAIYINTDWE